MKNKSSLLLVYKPPGITSFSSLSPVKRTLGKKVGHAGTLDKFAEGLMIVLTGTFTKLNPLLSQMDKRYVATIEFGNETSTLDPEGEVVATGPIPSLTIIESVVANQFVGTINQIPPTYSAIHVDGKRAYRLAREGKDVDIPSRPITIFSASIVSWESPRLVLFVHCSKGTYIRSLARDIALACGSRAHLVALERTTIGPFSLEDAVDPMDSAALLHHADSSRERLLKIEHMGQLTVSAEASLRLTYGNLPQKSGIIISNVQKTDRYATVSDETGNLLAVVGLDTYGVPNKVMALPCMELA